MWWSGWKDPKTSNVSRSQEVYFQNNIFVLCSKTQCGKIPRTEKTPPKTKYYLIRHMKNCLIEKIRSSYLNSEFFFGFFFQLNDERPISCTRLNCQNMTSVRLEIEKNLFSVMHDRYVTQTHVWRSSVQIYFNQNRFFPFPVFKMPWEFTNKRWRVG